MTKRKQFTSEFKRESVRLFDSGEKPAAQLAKELGIRRNQLYKWKEEVASRGKETFPGKGRRPSNESQLSENER